MRQSHQSNNKMKDVSVLYAELGNSSEVITKATGKVIRVGVSKTSAECCKNTRRKAVFDISSPRTPTFGGKKNWMLVVEVSTDLNVVIFKKNIGVKKCGVVFNDRFKSYVWH